MSVKGREVWRGSTAPRFETVEGVMTDRELLELAAKAAGIQLRWHEPALTDGVPDDFADSEWCWIPNAKPPHDRRESDKTGGIIWTPLTDDGDTLRLAVKLGIGVEFGYCEDDAPVLWTHHKLLGRSRYPNFPDPYAATRRAVVRAAADIGKAMP